MAGGLILVVDDDPAERSLLRRALELDGHRVLEAADGQEALDAAACRRPDLVLLDLEMPRLDGYAVCRRLRDDPETRLLPILVVTALGNLPEKLRALRCGVNEVIQKPVRVAELRVRVAGLLEHRRHVLELERASLVVEAIARAVERRDAYTAAHSGRVGAYALRLGRAFGMSEEDLDTLRLGASLHDVGKIGVPDAVLLKPGRLTEEEFRVIRAHPLIGAELCAPMRSLARAIPLVRHHHERLDGSGYPDGLRGEQIPLLVRVLSVADVFDALTSARRYRPEMPPEKALAILDEEARRGWWDSEVVAAWKGLIRREIAA
jgi:putative two-component system response regulator